MSQHTGDLRHSARGNPQARRKPLALALALAFTCFAATAISSHAQELMIAQTMPDLVAQAEWISVAELVDAHARWNARGNLIVTDYRFRQQQSLLGMPPTIEFVLTQGGGTLNGETHRVSDTPALVVGHAYLLFVSPERGEMFAPFVGGAQGAYELLSDGRAVALTNARRVQDANALLKDVRDLATQRGTARPRTPVRAGASPTGPYPAKTYLPLALAPARTAATRAPLISDAVAAPSGVRPPTTAAVPALSGDGTESVVTPSWHFDHRVTPPIVINAFPHDFVWHPYEENQLAYWNQYGGDIFRVYETPTGTWAWNNGVFDLAGFPSNDDMIAQFGEGWGATTLGITYSRWVDDGPTIEADTALNPAYCWTLDDRYGTDGTATCWGFRQTMLHEVGHTWGLQHPWETQDVSWDSVMNYSPHDYRFPELFVDDTAAVRNAFGGLPIHDASLSLYTTSFSSTGASSPNYTSTQAGTVYVQHGQDLAAFMPNRFKIENTGTDDIVSPEIDFYLTQNRMSFADSTYQYIGNAIGSTVPVNYTLTYAVPSLPLPTYVPTGNYFFAAYLPGADAVSANNGAWVRQSTQVHVDNVATTLFPTPDWALSEVGQLGPQGSWSFVLVAEAGVTYDLSLCEADGGYATFDTTLAIADAFNDDSCGGLQSRLAWTAPNAGTFYVTVRSYEDSYQGSFQLAYRRETVDPVFFNGFDG